MNKETFKNILKEDKKLIDNTIKKYFSNQNNKLEQAVFYAIDGGKRIRPIIFLETIKMLKGKDFSQKDLDFAISIEMIHSYSLIHDDLPAMDNDDYRRGKETVHKKFGEDIAVLAGDSLLNTAYENILNMGIEDSNITKAGYYLGKCAGKSGMIEGQYFDIYKEDFYDLDYVFKVYEKKTGGLFKASVLGAGLFLGCDKNVLENLETYGKYLGLSFQLQDDLIDEQAEEELNILNLINKKEACDYLNGFNEKAKNAIKNFDKNDFHIFLIDYLSTRTI